MRLAPFPICKESERKWWISRFTKSSQKISTHLLTVLTMRVIVSIEHEKSMFIKQLYDILDIIVTDEQR